MYRAVHLSVPNVIAQFKTVYRDSDGVMIDSRTYNVDLNTGTTIDWDVSLQVSSPGPSTLVPPGWYVALDTEALSHTLLAGLDINPLDGWDVTKLGWMKAGGRDEVVTSSLEQLAASFSPQVENCARGQHQGFFAQSVKIDQSKLEGGRALHHLYPFVSGVRIWRRHVEVEHGESPLLALTLQHRSRVGVVVQYSASQLEDFTGLLYQDAASHLHLNLSLLGAAGTVTGVIRDRESGATQSFLLRLPLQRSNSSHQVRLSARSPCRGGQVEVSLKPLSAHNSSISKQLPCVSHNMRTFRSTASRSLSLPSASDPASVTECGLACVSSWLYWLDPAHWLDTIWPQSRVVIFIIILVILIVILSILTKMFLALCNFCVCRRKKK